ncbi:MAG TPA: hypothetical protein VK484_01780 [Ferruginibacter sp.]|nr:hypothetical protein [Ferruginibacter sp.]
MTDPGVIQTPLTATSPVLDSLQGKWKHYVTTYIRVNPFAGPTFTIVDADSCEFRPDLTGRDHFPQPQAYPYPTVNFTYNLLPDDSTLIFNTGSVMNPVYDTVIIVTLNNGLLRYKSKAKTFNFPTIINGTFYVDSELRNF